MRKTLKFLIAICCVMLLNSCASLQPVIVTHHTPLNDYRYVYITPTVSLTSGTGSVYGGNYRVYGSSVSKSVNPSDIIAGYMMKKGYIQISEIKPELASQTLIVNYGETGRRYIWGGLLGYTIEVTLQFLSAQTHEVVCTSTAEGIGSTEADDIRIAINRALDEVFSLK
ncbi:MAG: hypothetical protein IIW13_03820 [Paludibacteraceae bacterium]|nr:hypothetical protein [Paludibacteraceae bacterium]